MPCAFSSASLAVHRESGGRAKRKNRILTAFLVGKCLTNRCRNFRPERIKLANHLVFVIRVDLYSAEVTQIERDTVGRLNDVDGWLAGHMPQRQLIENIRIVE